MIDDYEQQINDLASDFDRAELIIAGIIASAGVASTAQVRQASAQVAQVTAELAQTVAAWIEANAPAMYRVAIADALASQATGRAPGSMTDSERARYNEQVRRIVASELHDESLNQLAEDMLEQLAQATSHMETDAKRQLRQMAREALREARESVEVLPQARTLARGMEGRRVRFTDRSGRRWKASRYARAVMTAMTATIQNAAVVNAGTEQGAPGVRVFDNEGPNSCAECSRVNGQHWSLAKAAANPIAHPHCVRAFGLLPNSYTGEVLEVESEVVA